MGDHGIFSSAWHTESRKSLETTQIRFYYTFASGFRISNLQVSSCHQARERCFPPETLKSQSQTRPPLLGTGRTGPAVPRERPERAFQGRAVWLRWAPTPRRARLFVLHFLQAWAGAVTPTRLLAARLLHQGHSSSRFREMLQRAAPQP